MGSRLIALDSIYCGSNKRIIVKLPPYLVFRAVKRLPIKFVGIAMKTSEIFVFFGGKRFASISFRKIETSFRV